MNQAMKAKTEIFEKLQVGTRIIGPDQPTYIIAEIGINHNGDPDIARKLIDAAAEARVDAVKFQKRCLASLYQEDVLRETEKHEQNFQYMIPILKKVELNETDFFELKRYSLEKGLEFLCTPFDIPSVDFLEKLGVRAFKVASADLNNLELLAYLADKGKPMLVSTGMSYWSEIEKAVELLRGKGAPFALLHCRSVYPVWPREVNLRMINRLSEFGCPVGYSGHDIGITVPLVAASMGASIIEKHITLDKSMWGPDHKISLEPYELKRLVRDIRVADQAMGKTQRFLLRGEIMNRELFGKSLRAAGELKSGTVILPAHVMVRGPGKGLSPCRMDDLIGKRIHRDIQKGDVFIDEDIEGPRKLDFSNSFRKRWGLISRFNDMEDMLSYKPKLIEFHLAEKDFNLGFKKNGSYSQELIVHAPEYIGDRLFDLCSGDEDIRSESIKMVQKTLDLTETLAPHFTGRPKVIIHPGAMSLNTKLDKTRLREALMRSLEEIKENDAEILLENLPPYPWYFGGQWKGNYFMDPDEIRSFCEETGRDICFDISHAALFCNAKEKDLAEFILKVKPHIRHLHIADAYGLDGEGVQIGEGDIDFDSVAPLFSDYRGTWVPEVWRGHLQNGRGFIDALMRLKKFNM
ncbi:MAG: N-acetylneuraminate synthase family protein [Deltaproteobacteria bacterium]|nr:N-acetylneuraminate synthase family protein [Deltaproteobacteria bacterium]